VADRIVGVINKRQNTPESKPYWEEFDLRWRSGMNVITGLMDWPADATSFLSCHQLMQSA